MVAIRAFSTVINKLKSALHLLAVACALIGVQLCALNPAKVRAAENVADAPFTMDEATFNRYFAPFFRSDHRNLDGISSAVAAKINLISFENTLTTEQIERLRMAGYVDMSRQARVALDARRAMLGKKYENLREASNDFQSSRYSRTPALMEEGSLMRKVYDTTLTPAQKKAHSAGVSERRRRMLDASIELTVLRLSDRVAMTVAQQESLVRAIKEHLKGDKLLEAIRNEDVNAVINYTIPIVLDEDSAALLDDAQRERIDKLIEKVGADSRTNLRSRGILEVLEGQRSDPPK